MRVGDFFNQAQTENKILFASNECPVNDVLQVDCQHDPDPWDPSNEDYVTADEVNDTWFRIDIACISLSMLSLSFVSWSILTDKRIRGHPNNIIALICLCDAYQYAQYLNRYFICGYDLSDKLQWVFSKTVMLPYWTISLKWFGTSHTNLC